MHPARLYAPSQLLLSPSWASNLNIYSQKQLRAVLQLPAELRPYALRSFHSLCYHQRELNESDNADPSPGSELPNAKVKQFIGKTLGYGGLRKTSAATTAEKTTQNSKSQHSVARESAVPKHAASVVQKYGATGSPRATHGPVQEAAMGLARDTKIVTSLSPRNYISVSERDQKRKKLLDAEILTARKLPAQQRSIAQLEQEIENHRVGGASEDEVVSKETNLEAKKRHLGHLEEYIAAIQLGLERLDTVAVLSDETVLSENKRLQMEYLEHEHKLMAKNALRQRANTRLERRIEKLKASIINPKENSHEQQQHSANSLEDVAGKVRAAEKRMQKNNEKMDRVNERMSWLAKWTKGVNSDSPKISPMNNASKFMTEIQGEIPAEKREISKAAKISKGLSELPQEKLSRRKLARLTLRDTKSLAEPAIEHAEDVEDTSWAVSPVDMPGIDHIQTNGSRLRTSQRISGHKHVQGSISGSVSTRVDQALRETKHKGAPPRPAESYEAGSLSTTIEELKAQIAELESTVISLTTQKESGVPKEGTGLTRRVQSGGVVTLEPTPSPSNVGNHMLSVASLEKASGYKRVSPDVLLQRSTENDPQNNNANLSNTSLAAQEKLGESYEQTPLPLIGNQSYGTSFEPQSSNEAQPSGLSPAELLAELFPEETTKPSPEPERESTSEGDVPRLPLPSDKEVTVRNEESKKVELVPGQKRRNLMTVLQLNGGNEALTEEDFRRLTPKGKHMKEWSVGGDFVTVFPRRDPWTLERKPPGNYFIVFENSEHARAYESHCHHVHRLARQHTPTSLSSPIPPPPGYLIDGEDVDKLIHNFALVAPMQPLSFTTYTVGPNFHEFKASLFRRGGYPEIVGTHPQSKTPQVLIRMLEGPQPTQYEIHDAIGKSGRERNLAWELVERPDAIRKLEMDRYARVHVGDGDNREDHDEEYRERVARVKKPGYGQCWILSFKKLEEAKTFVRVWHRRPFPWDKKGKDDDDLDWTVKRFGEQVTVVEAELLW